MRGSGNPEGSSTTCEPDPRIIGTDRGEETR